MKPTTLSTKASASETKRDAAPWEDALIITRTESGKSALFDLEIPHQVYGLLRALPSPLSWRRLSATVIPDFFFSAHEFTENLAHAECRAFVSITAISETIIDLNDFLLSSGIADTADITQFQRQNCLRKLVEADSLGSTLMKAGIIRPKQTHFINRLLRLANWKIRPYSFPPAPGETP